jgi:hypothetical protein
MNELTVIVNSLKTFCTLLLRSVVRSVLICLIEKNFVFVDDFVVFDVVVSAAVVILVVVNVLKTLTLSKYI